MYKQNSLRAHKIYEWLSYDFMNLYVFLFLLHDSLFKQKLNIQKLVKSKIKQISFSNISYLLKVIIFCLFVTLYFCSSHQKEAPLVHSEDSLANCNLSFLFTFSFSLWIIHQDQAYKLDMLNFFCTNYQCIQNGKYVYKQFS